MRREDGTGSRTPPEAYQLGGAWPHFYAFFDAINLGDTGSVIFDLEFPAAQTDDVVEFILDAYQDSAAEGDGGGIPVAGYTPGSGPTGAAAQAAQIAPAPVKRSLGILTTET